MGAVQLSFFFIGGAVCLFVLLFCLTSLGEKKPRAALVSAALCAAWGLIWFGGYFVFQPSDLILLIPVLVVFLFAVLFFMPLGIRKPLQIGEVTERVDERDVMFAREEYEPGTERYEKYYAMRPEKKRSDDAIRKLPELLEPGGRY